MDATASRAPGPRSTWLLPRPTLTALAVAMARLAVVGLLVVGTSGVLIAVFGAAFGTTFVAGDPPGVTYSRARCADYRRYVPAATTCEEAATIHHYGEGVQYPLAAGCLGLVGLGALALARRKIQTEPHALPFGFELTVGTAMFGIAGVLLIGSALSRVGAGHAQGVGQSLAEGVVAAAAFVAYDCLLYRKLLGRAATGRAGPS